MLNTPPADLNRIDSGPGGGKVEVEGRGRLSLIAGKMDVAQPRSAIELKVKVFLSDQPACILSLMIIGPRGAGLPANPPERRTVPTRLLEPFSEPLPQLLRWPMW